MIVVGIITLVIKTPNIVQAGAMKEYQFSSRLRRGAQITTYDVSADVFRSLQDCLDCIMEGLTNGKNIELRNFGVFELQVRKQRVGRNPNQPETDVVIPRRAVVKFKAGKEMKAGLDKLDLDQF